MQWIKLAPELNDIDTAKIPRFLGTNPNVVLKRELHVFCDSSFNAYAACAYLREITGSWVTSNLILSKTRIAPIKTMSIPRLELVAALIGSRMIMFLQNALPFDISNICLWSDSTCVLHWILGSKSHEVFAENHLKEIRSVKHLEYRHVDTEENPADLPTRGLSVAALIDSDLWWHGPQWLTTNSDQYCRKANDPVPPLTEDSSITPVDVHSSGWEDPSAMHDDALREEPSLIIPDTNVTAAVQTTQQNEPFIDLERYSS